VIEPQLDAPPTDEEIELGHELSGKIILPSVLRADGETYVVNDNLSILGSLRIEPGVEIIIRDGKQIEVKGSLIAEGMDKNKITFASEIPLPGNWKGIYIKESGYAVFRNADISSAEVGIDTEGYTLIASSTIWLNNSAISVHSNAQIIIFENLIYNNSNAIILEKDIVLTNCTFVNNTNTLYSSNSSSSAKLVGCKVNDGSFSNNYLRELHIRNSEIQLNNNGYIHSNELIDTSDSTFTKNVNLNSNSVIMDNINAHTIYINTGFVEMRESTITDYAYIYLQSWRSSSNATNSSVANCKIKQMDIYNEKEDQVVYISNNNICHVTLYKGIVMLESNFLDNFEYDTAIDIQGGNVVMENNYINSNRYYTGIRISNSSMPALRNNTISNCSNGIEIADGFPIIFEKNKFVNLNTAVKITNLAIPSLTLTMKDNIFDSSTNNMNVSNESSGTVDVSGNYWGTVDETEIWNKLNNVIMPDGYLTEPPQDAGSTLEATKSSTTTSSRYNQDLMKEYLQLLMEKKRLFEQSK